MRRLHVAMIDDNGAWLAKAKPVIETFAEQEGIDLTLNCYTSEFALLTSEKSAPDALFCDIEIGDNSGIDFAKQVHQLWSACQVVFVTNHLQYALDVYETEHVWFVLKDQFAWRLPEVMKKLTSHVDERNATILLKTTAHDLVTLPCLELSYLERSGRITKVHTGDGTVYQVSDRISELIQRLPPGHVARCHGSFAVAFAHVRRIEAAAVLTVEGWEVPLSRRFSRSFKESYLGWVDSHVV